MSRHALIFRRRHTQHSGSPAASTVVSALQTMHLAAFLKRSEEMDCFACSRISAGTTGSDLVGTLRFMETQSVLTMTESQPRYNHYGPTPLRAPGLLPPLPVRNHIAGTWIPWQLEGTSPSGQCPPAPCGCRSGNARVLVSGVPTNSSFFNQPSLSVRTQPRCPGFNAPS
jgi:hypothetical protein